MFPPPAGYNISADFIAIPTEGIAPFTVHFFDRSSGNPDAWDWDWWDGTKHGMRKNQSHTYTKPGTHTGQGLTASNNYSSDTVIQYRYITVYNGGISRTNTTITGLAITGCGARSRLSPSIHLFSPLT